MKNYFTKLSVWSFFCLVSEEVWADVHDAYQFSTQAQLEQFQRLTEQLRCLVCQNQSLADSHAPLAQDLRLKVAELIKQQLSEQQIIDFLVQRYGDFILYKPPLNLHTYALWFAPILLLGVGIGMLVFFILRQRRLSRTTPR